VAREDRARENVEWGATVDVDPSGLEVEGSIAVRPEPDDTPGPALGLEVADGAGVEVAVEVGGAVAAGVEVGASVEVGVPVAVPVKVPVEAPVEVEVVDPEAAAGAVAPGGAAPVAGSPPGVSLSGSIDAIANPSVLPLSAKASVARKGMVRLTQRASSAM
jgi:hypothetical protein